MDGAALRIHAAEGGRWLTAPRRPATLQRARSLRPSLDDKSPEIIYVESRMLPTLFDRDGELLTAFRRWFRVFIVVNVLPGGKVLIFIIGWPFYQYLAMLLITTMAFQLRIRRNNSDQTAVKFCADLGGSV